jgi:hypothetical protein
MVLSLRHHDVASTLTSRQWRLQAFPTVRGGNLIQILLVLVIVYHVFVILLAQSPEEAIYVFLLDQRPPRGLMMSLGNFLEGQFKLGLILGQPGRIVV